MQGDQFKYGATQEADVIFFLHLEVYLLNHQLLYPIFHFQQPIILLYYPIQEPLMLSTRGQAKWATPYYPPLPASCAEARAAFGIGAAAPGGRRGANFDPLNQAASAKSDSGSGLDSGREQTPEDKIKALEKKV